MDDLLRELWQLTLEIVNHIKETTVSQMEDFVQQREVLLTEIQKQPLLPAEREQYSGLIAQILECDPIILTKMNQLKEEAAAGMSKISTVKVQHDAYDAIYTPDSIFFDEKK